MKSHPGEGSAFTITLPFGASHLPKERISAPAGGGSTNQNPALTGAAQPDSAPRVRAGLRAAIPADAFTGEAMTWLARDRLSYPSDDLAAAHSRDDAAPPPQILIADDNADMREHLSRILNGGYKITAVADGAAALQAARERKPDLVLADVMMPGLDGFGLLRELRADEGLREVPIVLISARAGDEARTEGIAAGADDYITKPFNAQELLARVRTTLDLQSVRRQAREAINALNAELASDLAAMTRLQQLSTRLVEAGELDALLGEFLDAAIEITRADKGNIQLLQDGSLKIVQQRGFEEPFLDFFNKVDHDTATACGTALERGERVIVEDVTASAIFAGTAALTVMLDAGARAVQSTPLVSRSGHILGMFSTHYVTASRKPAERDLRLLDLLGRQAADLIERSLAEERLRQSEAQFKRLVESNIVGIVIANEKRVIDANDVYLRMLDCSREDLLAGRADWARATPPESYVKDVEAIRQLREHGACAPYEKEYIRPDGSRAPILIGVAALEGYDELTWICVVVDMNEQKRLQNELLSANEQLSRANRDLEQFAYSASHDLQEPLRTVKIFSELLDRGYREKLDGQALEFLGNVTSGAARMEALVRDLLSYTHANRFDIPAEPVAAQGALDAATANLAGAISASDARIASDPLPSLPVNGTHLEQLFQNLIGNAIKYSRPGVPPVVHVSARKDDENWLFSVADNGIGIEAEYKERIFGLFKRLHSADRYSGTGIGLALCQRIVERYHGRIWVESEPGKGSSFFFTLPA